MKASHVPAHWFLVLSLLSCAPATPAQPGAVEVQFLGRVKLVLPASPAPSAETQPLPRYLPMQALRMRWQPLPLVEGQCSPFGHGQVQVRFRPEKGAPLLERLLPLKPPWVQPVEGGLLVELPGVSSEGTSPASSAEGLKQGVLPLSPDKQDPFVLPAQPGLYQLELDWRCLPEGPVRTQVYPVRVDQPPEQQPPLMTWLAQLSPQDTPERSAMRIEALLEQGVAPEQRLWLRKRQVQLLHQATLMASRAVWEARAIEIRLEQKTAISALQVLEQGAWQRFHSQTARERHSFLEGASAVSPALSTEGASAASTAGSAAVSPAASTEGFQGGARVEAQRQTEQVSSQKLLELLEERQRAQQRRPPSAERMQSLQRLEQQREILLAELEMGVPQVLNPSVPRLDVVALQRRLSSRGEGDDQLLRVTVLPDGVVRWYISSTDLSVDRLSLSRAEVEQQVQALVDALQRGQPLPVEGRRLWEWLREPLQPRAREGEQGGRRPPLLTLVVDGPLRALPWGALPFRGGVLLDDYALRWRPSLLWQPPELKGDEVLVVGNPTRDLPQTERVAERVAEQLSGRWWRRWCW
ncbi:MAG: hypothetical protein ACKO6N_08025 [Myxococcota bacterium]